MTLKSVLRFSWAYDLSQTLFGVPHARKWFVQEMLRPLPTDHVFEVGCGTGVLLDMMPPIASYFGYDISETYIRTARLRYPQYRFEAAAAEDLLRGPPIPSDIVFCLGVLHHLDEAQFKALMRLAAMNMKPGARFIALEPCYLKHHAPLSRWFISRDRGGYVRSVSEYVSLLKEEFEVVESEVVSGLLNLPYMHLAIECKLPKLKPQA